MKIILIFTLLCYALSLENGVGRTPPMGWNSWNHYYCNINEDIVKKTTDILVSSGLAELGYSYVNVDDCWQASRDTSGKIVEDKNNFPNGMKVVADYVHSKGLKFGLYSDAGTNTCQGRPGSLGFEEIDAKTYAEWGVDYLKYDNCYNTGSSSKDRYPPMTKALNNTGRAIYFSMCNWGEENPATWARPYANSWRTTGDITDSWDSFTKLLDLQVGLEAYAGPGGWNDPDMLEVGNGGMTNNEYQAHFALWALLKSPLLIGCDLTNISKETLEILSNDEIIAINQDSLGIQGKRVSSIQKSNGNIEVWAGPLSGNSHAIILFNRSGQKEKIHFAFKDIGFTSLGGNLRNLITHESYGYIEESHEEDVESHSVVVLKLHQYCSNDSTDPRCII